MPSSHSSNASWALASNDAVKKHVFWSCGSLYSSNKEQEVNKYICNMSVTFVVVAQLLSHVWLFFVTPWTVACHAPLCMGFSRQEYWSGLPFPSPGDLPDPGMEPRSPALQADSLPFELPGIYMLVSPIRCWLPRERGCPLLHWLWGLCSDPGTQWAWWSTGRPSLENNSFVRGTLHWLWDVAAESWI